MDRVWACASPTTKPRSSGRQTRAGSRPCRGLRAAAREPAAARAGVGAKLSEGEAGRGVAERPLGEREGSGREANRPRRRRHEDAGRAARLGRIIPRAPCPNVKRNPPFTAAPSRPESTFRSVSVRMNGCTPSGHSASLRPAAATKIPHCAPATKPAEACPAPIGRRPSPAASTPPRHCPPSRRPPVPVAAPQPSRLDGRGRPQAFPRVRGGPGSGASAAAREKGPRPASQPPEATT